MSVQVRDLICDKDHILWGHVSAFEDIPRCPECGGELEMCWVGGKPPATDVFGCAQYSDATGEFHTSQRDKIRVMKDVGFEEAGDLVGGARKDHTLKNTGFSFSGQGSRRTVSEG